MPRESPSHHWALFAVSLFVPCLGLLVRKYFRLSMNTLLLGAGLGLMTFFLSRVGGPGAGVFFGILLIFPWWVFQAFQSALPHPTTLSRTWEAVWTRAHDIRFIGILFLVAAVTDLYIIIKNPEYQLNVFCSRPTGVAGTLAKLQSPMFHVAIGYGFVRLLRWSLFVYLLYAGYGLLNATVNFACEGYGRIRTVFFVSLLIFTVYILFRRKCFGGFPD